MTAFFTMIAALAALVMLNVPIAIALGVIAVAAIWITQGAYMLPNLALVMFEGATSFPLLAIPMFILAGAIMNSSSITQRLMDLASAMVGFIRGGLAHVNIVQSMFFAEISGSAVADVAATGPIIMPAMIKRGYSREFTAAVTSSSASLAIIIPPSIPDDPLWRDWQCLDRPAVRRRHHSRHPRRLRHDGDFLLSRAASSAGRWRTVSGSAACGRHSRRRPGRCCSRSSFWAAFSAASSPPPKAPRSPCLPPCLSRA